MPYIDVMLVLLIIFMITAPLLSQGVKVDLPQVPSEVMPPTDKEPVVVSVNAAGNFFINYGDNQDKSVSTNALIKYQPDIPVFVKGDSSVPYGRVVELMALLQSAGVDGVGLVTESPEQ